MPMVWTWLMAFGYGYMMAVKPVTTYIDHISGMAEPLDYILTGMGVMLWFNLLNALAQRGSDNE